MRHTLHENYIQFKKVTSCFWHKQGCTKNEIRQGQIIAAELLALILIMVTGGFYITKEIRKSLVYRGPKSEMDLPDVSSYVTPKGLITDIQNVIADHEFIITDKTIDTIESNLKGSHEKAEQLLQWMLPLVDEKEISFAGPGQDFKLWKLFSDYSVIPYDQKRRIGFYTWEKGKITGIAHPQPVVEGPVRIGTTEPTKKGIEE